MDFLECYEDKICEYTDELKSATMPLMSWDIHMAKYTDLNHLNKDIIAFQKFNDKFTVEVDLVEELLTNKAVIVVTDTNLTIEYASSNMMDMSGYLPSEVLGKSPKIFQGAMTNKEISKQIRTSVNKTQVFEATLVNYKKDNSVYNCHIKGYPVFNSKGDLVKYVAIEHSAA